MEEISGEVKASRGISMKVLAIILLVIILLSFFSFYGIRKYQCNQLTLVSAKFNIYYFKCLSLCPPGESKVDYNGNNITYIDTSCASYCGNYVISKFISDDRHVVCNTYDSLSTKTIYNCYPNTINNSPEFKSCLDNYFNENKHIIDLSNFVLENYPKYDFDIENLSCGSDYIGFDVLHRAGGGNLSAEIELRLGGDSQIIGQNYTVPRIGESKNYQISYVPISRNLPSLVMFRIYVDGRLTPIYFEAKC